VSSANLRWKRWPRSLSARDGLEPGTHPDPKIHDEHAGGSTRRSAAEPGPSSWLRADTRGGFEGDLVAEGLELADVVAHGAFRTDAGVVEAGAEVVEPEGRVGQQVPDNDQDGPADRDDGVLLAASTGDPPEVSRRLCARVTREGRGSRRRAAIPNQSPSRRSPRCPQSASRTAPEGYAQRRAMHRRLLAC
jgi:hypothetical protein